MSVVVDGDTVRLEGDCRVEDAEPLLSALQSAARPTVDLRACHSLHSAVVQILLALAPDIGGECADAFVAERVEPALRRAWNRLQA